MGLRKWFAEWREKNRKVKVSNLYDQIEIIYQFMKWNEQFQHHQKLMLNPLKIFLKVLKSIRRKNYCGEKYFTIAKEIKRSIDNIGIRVFVMPVSVDLHATGINGDYPDDFYVRISYGGLVRRIRKSQMESKMYLEEEIQASLFDRKPKVHVVFEKGQTLRTIPLSTINFTIRNDGNVMDISLLFKGDVEYLVKAKFVVSVSTLNSFKFDKEKLLEWGRKRSEFEESSLEDTF